MAAPILLKAGTFLSLKKISCLEMQQLILGIGLVTPSVWVQSPISLQDFY
jgi:hypothetical protein